MQVSEESNMTAHTYSQWSCASIREGGIIFLAVTTLYADRHRSCNFSQFCWQCEQLICAHTAYIDTQMGIYIFIRLEKILMSRKTLHCKGRFEFDRQQQTGQWKLNVFKDHRNECGKHNVSVGPLGAVRTTSARACYLAYIPYQVVRCVLPAVVEDPNITSSKISEFVSAH